MLGASACVSLALSLLIVEDEPRLLESTRLLLSNYVSAIETAASGREALHKLTAKHFDVVLMDMGLPDMGGHEVMAEIRSHWPETIIIVISGEANIDSAIQALRLGAYDYLRKPYQPEELIKAIRNSSQKLHVHDISQNYQQMLQHSEYLHRLIVNRAPDIIYTLDPQGRFTFVNESVRRILDIDTESLIGEHYDQIVFQSDIPLARHAMNERRTGERATQNRELRLRRNGSTSNQHTDYVTVELTSMGLYRETPDGQKVFLGSYGVARDITERKEAEATITFQAYHDLLTGLPNRALFKDRLSQAIAQCKRESHSLAVLFLDLDHFKMVNDTLGHLVGDELLQALSHRLRNSLREGDTLARIGGDEFLILLPHVTCRENAAAIANKVFASLKTPFEVEGHELFVTMSIGIALYPDDADQIDTLIKNADIAMYQAKDKGRNDYCFFSNEFNHAISGRLDMQSGLRRALQRGEFEVFYQPQVHIASGRIVGMEALVRWQHPEKGLIQPQDFIPIAEESGLISGICEWVVQTAFKQARAWAQSGLPPLALAVNLSARQIEHPKFVDNFIQILEANHIDGRFVEIELTESTLMRDMEGCISKLKLLNELGVAVSIDDFGTGYSSLSYLKRLPVNTLKIDQSFIRDLSSGHRHTSIVDGITAMAKGLRLNVIAEGVESVEQLDYLRRVGCDVYQGFLFSKPVDSVTATALLQKDRLSHARFN